MWLTFSDSVTHSDQQQAPDDRESITLTEKTGTVEQEETFWRFKKKEQMEDSTAALIPKTMSQRMRFCP